MLNPCFTVTHGQKRVIFVWMVYEVYVQTRKSPLSSTKVNKYSWFWDLNQKLKFSVYLYTYVCSFPLVLWFLSFPFPLIIIIFTLFSSPYHLLLLSFWISYLYLQLFLSEGLFHSIHFSSFTSPPELYFLSWKSSIYR